MNIVGNEIYYHMDAKIGGCEKDHRKVVYSLADAYNNLCIDKREIILAQVTACEVLVKFIKGKMIKNIQMEHL